MLTINKDIRKTVCGLVMSIAALWLIFVEPAQGQTIDEQFCAPVRPLHRAIKSMMATDFGVDEMLLGLMESAESKSEAEASRSIYVFLYIVENIEEGLSAEESRKECVKNRVRIQYCEDVGYSHSDPYCN